jgi:hypothetical protein
MRCINGIISAGGVTADESVTAGSFPSARRGVWDSTWKRIDGRDYLTRPYGKKVRFSENDTVEKRMLQRNELSCPLANLSCHRLEMIPHQPLGEAQSNGTTHRTP